jgi:hypothetical protein
MGLGKKFVGLKYKRASSALKAARKLIEDEKGWVQEYLAVSTKESPKTGDPVRCGTKSEHASAFCALGAVKRVNGPAERAAVAFLREAGRKILGDLAHDKDNDQNIFDVNDDMGHKSTLKMFDIAIKAALKAGN